MGAFQARLVEAIRDSQADDGSFGDGRYGRNVAVTSIACLAFMADGNLPGRGRYGEEVQKGLDFILNNINETGLIAGQTSHGPMYGHGFAALFLGEVYGMTQGGADTAKAERVHDALVRAIRLIVQTQNNEGGWRYNPVPYDADISVTICEIMALRSARNAGIEVPKETIDRAIEYVRKCQNTDGGFRYQLPGGGSAWPSSNSMRGRRRSQTSSAPATVPTATYCPQGEPASAIVPSSNGVRHKSAGPTPRPASSNSTSTNV